MRRHLARRTHGTLAVETFDCERIDLNIKLKRFSISLQIIT